MIGHAYYNEHNREAAAWLRELIRAGHIAPGEVDERSIVDVQPDDLRGFGQCHFFAGIGGWSLALRLAGWPDAQPVWTGSCPCQPLSCAGLGLGHADERHLWPAFYRLIAECGPATVFGEQVASAAGREWLAGVRTDLEGAGYACGCSDLCAASVGAPHRRQRLFWVANTEHAERWAQHVTGENGPDRQNDRWTKTHSEFGTCGEVCQLANATDERHGQQRHANGRRREPERGSGLGTPGQSGLEKRGGDTGFQRATLEPLPRQASQRAGQSSGFWTRCDWLPCRDGKARRVESGTFPLVDGFPGRVGLLRGYGNAIVPQVAAHFIQAFCDAQH